MRKSAEARAVEEERRKAKIAWYRRLWDRVCEVDTAGHGNAEEAVAEACNELHIKRASFYRYLKRYRADPRLKALSPRLSRLVGETTPRSPKRSLELLQEVIEKHYLTRERKPVSKVFQVYENICWREGVDAVSPSTMWRQIRAIPESVVARKRDPLHLRGKKYRLNHAVSEIAYAPLEVVQIDHRQLDIEAVDSETRLPCGRPWLTAIVDHYTRAILGLYLTLEAPSSISTARALLHAATPKGEYMTSLEVPGIWEMHGIPALVYTDNGPDFASEAIRDGYRRQGLKPPMFRPGGQPHYGGVVERMLQTLGFIFKGEGGDTGISIADRGDRKPEKSACLTLDEIERILANFIANDYHVNRFSKNASPRRLWQKSLQDGLFQQRDIPGEALRHLYIDFLRTESRSISQMGVRIENFYFAAPILNKWMARGQFKHDFHIDIKDARCIYFKDPDDGLYYEIPCTIPDLEPISFKDAKVRLKEIWAESDDPVDREELMNSRDLNLRIAEVAASATKSKKAVMAAEKKRRTETPSIVRRFSPLRHVAQAPDITLYDDEDEKDDVEIVAFETTTLMMEKK